MTTRTTQFTRWFEETGNKDVPEVGGKNASLGEMVRELKDRGVKVPDGFATTAEAYRTFLSENGLVERIRSAIGAWERGDKTLSQTGESIRRMILEGKFSVELAGNIRDSYQELGRRYDQDNVSVAVRSSATAEDLPEASFAGQQESFLNVVGEDAVLDTCRRCYASLFTDRAISYRKEKGFDHMDIALSVGVQKMVRSDLSCSGVMFSLDTESGFRDAIVIDGSWGLGEAVVQGAVNPDTYMTFKPLLEKRNRRPIIGKTLGEKAIKIVYAEGGAERTRTIDTTEDERSRFVLNDEEILKLSRWGAIIEEHYGKPMDIEWARDGELNELFIVQARPETVESQKQGATLKTYTLKERGELLVSGLSIGQAVATGKAQVIMNASDIGRFEDGSVLVTGMTDPDWVPIMRRAAAIVTDLGGRTSHAAIVSRELGITAVVGTGNATSVLKDGEEVTVSCAEGDQGNVYRGKLAYEEQEIDISSPPQIGARILMNISSPAAAFRWWRLPVEGIGLARIEFIVNNIIKIHPMALVQFDNLEDDSVKQEIRELTRGYPDMLTYFVDQLAQGVARIGASRYPKPVIVRMSDFKTNEYANLIGGQQFEPKEENPMLGFRGASRYYSPRYREGFNLECRAIKKAREEMGLTNIVVMIPFCRTPEEAKKVLDVMAENGLKRGAEGLEVYVMAEVPSNIFMAEEFAEYFDGFSIGSNDLTQLVLGVDRDSAELAYLFNEQHEAVKRAIAELIKKAHKHKRKVGLCGQAPSDHPEFADFLVKSGIDTISLNPDSVMLMKRGK